MRTSKDHWENVYETKTPEQVSWTQTIPSTSLSMIASTGLPKSASIIDIGGGDSQLVDHLLALGYEHVTVLDISAKAIEKAKTRLGDKARKVTWIVSDIDDFEPECIYDVWHDRATFHFLTRDDQKSHYVDLVQKFTGGYMILGTFSENGPLKCSGLDICQYSETTMGELFSPSFEKIKCHTADHTTPFGTSQNFIYCTFKNN